jgi:hypothetical protein
MIFILINSIYYLRDPYANLVLTIDYLTSLKRNQVTSNVDMKTARQAIQNFQTISNLRAMTMLLRLKINRTVTVLFKLTCKAIVN